MKMLVDGKARGCCKIVISDPFVWPGRASDAKVVSVPVFVGSSWFQPRGLLLLLRNPNSGKAVRTEHKINCDGLIPPTWLPPSGTEGDS